MSPTDLSHFVRKKCKPRAGRTPPVSASGVAEAINAIENSQLTAEDVAEAQYYVGMAFLTPGDGEARMQVQKDPETGRYRYRHTMSTVESAQDSVEDDDETPAVPVKRKNLDDAANKVMAEIFEQRKMAVVAKRGGKTVEERADQISAAREDSLRVEIPDHMEATSAQLTVDLWPSL